MISAPTLSARASSMMAVVLSVQILKVRDATMPDTIPTVAPYSGERTMDRMAVGDQVNSLGHSRPLKLQSAPTRADVMSGLWERKSM